MHSDKIAELEEQKLFVDQGKSKTEEQIGENSVRGPATQGKQCILEAHV